MTGKVKLFNQGQRSITYGVDADGKNLTINPKETHSLSKKDADYLQSLYGDELLDVDKAGSPSDKQAAANADATDQAKDIIAAAHAEADNIKKDAQKAADDAELQRMEEADAAKKAAEAAANNKK